VREGLRQRVAIAVGVERRQLGEAVVQDSVHPRCQQLAAARSAAVLVDARRVLPVTRRRRRSGICSSCLRIGRERYV
jgi:Cdc6-like AAA superfamily ATPase